MRRILILLIAVFMTSALLVSGVDGAVSSTKRAIAHRKIVKMHRVKAKSKMARMHRAKTKYKVVCYRVRRDVRHHKRAVPARRAAGPAVTCPAPVVNVPQQPAPVVNVPQQPTPVVNVPPPSGITTDANLIYIVRGDELLILDKCTLCVKKQITLSKQPTE